jgi:hypothetical protein
MRHWIVAGACAAFVGALLAWFARDHVRTSGASLQQSDAVPPCTETTGPAAAPIAPLMKQPAAPRRAASPASEAEPEQLSSSKERPPRTPHPLEPGELVIRAKERVELAHRWESQAKDAQWSNETEWKVQDLLDKAKLDVNAVSNVDCRATICRFELFAGDGETAFQVIKVARSANDDTWVDHHAAADDTWRIEVFASRSGYRLSGDGQRIANAL